MANAKTEIGRDYQRGKLTQQVMAEAYEKLHPYGLETETKDNGKLTHDAKVAQKKLDKENKKRTANGQQTIAEEFEQSDFGQKYNTFKNVLDSKVENISTIQGDKTRTALDDDKKINYITSDDGKTYMPEKDADGNFVLDSNGRVSGKEVEISGIDEVRDGDVRVKLSDGSVVSAKDLLLPGDVAKQYAHAAWYDDTDIAKAFIAGYSSYEGTIEAYAEEFMTAYKLGKEAGSRGLPEMIKTLPKSRQKSFMQNDAIAAAFDAGKATAKRRAEDAAKMEKAREGKKSRSKKAGGKFSIAKSIDKSKLTGKQKRFIKMTRLFSKCFTSLSVKIVNSKPDANGEYHKENGSYDPVTNTILININAGKGKVDSFFDYLLNETLSHEVVHYIKAHSLTDCYALLDYLKENVYTDIQWNNLVRKRLEQYRKKNPDYTREDAEEEVVANACQTMLNSHRVLMALAKKNLTLLEKIKLRVASFFDNLERKLGTQVNYTWEARVILAESKKRQKELEKKFVEAVRNARSDTKLRAESTKNAESVNENTNGDSEKQKSVTGINQEKMHDTGDNVIADNDEANDIAFVGEFTRKSYTFKQAELLASLTVEALQNAMDSSGALSFNMIGLGGDTATQQEWIDSGLTYIEDGQVFVDDSAVLDERDRRRALKKKDNTIKASLNEKNIAKIASNMTAEERNNGVVVAEFIENVNQMIDESKRSKRKKRIGVVSKEHATAINELMRTLNSDFSAEGYELWIDGTGAQHIEIRHGKNGKADRTMASKEAKSLIPWAAQNADKSEFIRDETGNIKRSDRFYNHDGTRAPEIRLEKNTSEGVVYVSECVPDSANKIIWITSAYINKKGSKGQLLNIEDESSPQLTPEASFDSNATNTSIPDNSEKSNSFSKNYEEKSSEERFSLLEDDEALANYTEEQYNDYGWARENDVLSATENARLRSLFADAVSKQSNPPKTKYGEYMIAIGDNVENKIAYMTGEIDNPVITRVLEIDENNETKLSEIRSDLYEAERRGIQQKTGGIFRRYHSTDFGDYVTSEKYLRKGQGYNNQPGVERGRSGATTSRVKEIRFDDEGNEISREYHKASKRGDEAAEQDSDFLIKSKNGNNSRLSMLERDEISVRDMLATNLLELAETKTEKKRVAEYRAKLDEQSKRLEEINKLREKLGSNVFYTSEARLVQMSTQKMQKELENKFIEAVRNARSDTKSRAESTKNAQSVNETVKASKREDIDEAEIKRYNKTTDLSEGAVLNGQERAEQQERSETVYPGRERSNAEVQGGAQSKIGNRPQVQEAMGKTNETYSGDRTHRRLNTESSPFGDKDFVIPKQDSDLYRAQRELSEEYGIECHIVKSSLWNRENPATIYRNKVYVAEDIDSDLLATLVPHESTRFKSLNFWCQR